MATITLKSLSPGLHRALKSRARRNKRSLNQEAIAVLEEAVAPEPKIDVEAMIRKAERFRASLAFKTTKREIDSFKKQGRM